jgi:hypothetical protein
LPALWYSNWERQQGYREHKLKERPGISWILHRSCSFDTWLPTMRPSVHWWHYAEWNMQFVWLWLSLLHQVEQHFQLCKLEGGQVPEGFRFRLKE